MATRFISAVIGIPIILIIAFVGLPWLSVLVAIIACLGTLEFYRMAEKMGARPAVLLGITWSLSFTLSAHGYDWMTSWIALGGVIVTLSWHQIGRLSNVQLFARIGVTSLGFRHDLVSWFYTTAGAFYVGWTLSLLLLLRQEINGLEWFLVVILGTFTTDTGAFLTGKALGKRLLAPDISPNKTVEGAIGGFLTGATAVVLLAYSLNLNISILESIVLGAMIGISAQMGDLIESKLKRAAGVKDAGHIIPGHGGILDRVDSIVLVIVVVYHFFVWTIK